MAFDDLILSAAASAGGASAGGASAAGAAPSFFSSLAPPAFNSSLDNGGTLAFSASSFALASSSAFLAAASYLATKTGSASG